MPETRTEVRDFLRFLYDNPGFGTKIAAPPDKSLVYCGHFFRAMWKDVDALQRSDPNRHDFVLLPTILRDLPPAPGTIHGTLNMLEHLYNLDRLEPWHENGFRAWQAVSGIYAANARGRVRFSIGYGVRASIGPKGPLDEPPKVFAATEIWVLLRNSKLDEVSRDMVAYLATCVNRGNSNIGVSLL